MFAIRGVSDIRGPVHEIVASSARLKDRVIKVQTTLVACPRNHQERTAVSRGGGGRFLLSESEDLSQRTDNDDLGVATFLARLDFDSLDTDDLNSLRALPRWELASRNGPQAWRGRQGALSSRGYPDEELFAVLEDRRQGSDGYNGDDADAVDAMIKMSPAATDDELEQRYTDYSAECYAILLEPTVWSSIECVAAKLIGTRQAKRSRRSGSYRRRRGETPPVGRFPSRSSRARRPCHVRFCHRQQT